MKKFNLIAALLLIALLLLQFSGCTPASESQDPSGTASPTNNASDSANAGDYVYVPEYTTLSGIGGYISTPRLYNDKIYFFDMDNYDGTGITYHSINLDGSGYTTLDAYSGFADPELEMPDEEGITKDFYSYINDFIINSDGTGWVFSTLSQGYIDDNTGEYFPDNVYLFQQIDIETGTPIKEIPLEDLDVPYGISNIAVDGNGNIVIVCYGDMGDNTIIAFSPDGTQLFDFTIDQNVGWMNGIVTLGDGTVALLMVSPPDYDIQIRPVDFTAKKLGDSLGAAPSNFYGTPFVDDNGLLYSPTDSALISTDLSTGEMTEMLNWLDCDINPNYISLISVTDDEILLFSTDWSDDNPTSELISLKKTNASEISQKTVITLGCIYMDYYLREMILDFNQKDPDYRIKVVEYTSLVDDWNDAITKLNTEIIAGDIPDILIVNEQLPINSYESKGLLEDLTPYLEGIELLPSIVKATSAADGKLYKIASSFYIATTTGNSDVVGDYPGWNMSEFTDIIAANPGKSALPSYYTQSQYMAMAKAFTLSEFVNYSTGEVKFDSPDFIELLNWIKTLPPDDENGVYNYTAPEFDMANGNLIANPTGITGFTDIMKYEALYGGKMVYKGFPCESKNGHALMLTTPLAMSSTSPNKDGAWRFMSTILSEDYFNSLEMYMDYGFPTVQSVFDKAVEGAMTENMNPDQIYDMTISLDGSGSYGAGGTGDDVEPSSGTIYPKGKITLTGNGADQVFEFFALTDEQLDKFLEMLDNISSSFTNDETLGGIIDEELAPFYSGQKTAEEVAKIIQSRAGIYVNEQR